MIKKILMVLGVGLIVIQFIRPSKNISGDHTHHVSTQYPMPDEVSLLMQDACNDCHSNTTRYPWYAEIQPVAWWLANHVEEGKKHLNFSEFTSRRIAWQNHKFEEVIEKVREKEMPLKSYTYLGLHPEANLTDAQRTLLTSWAQTQMDTLASRYPADSLVLRRR